MSDPTVDFPNSSKPQVYILVSRTGQREETTDPSAVPSWLKPHHDIATGKVDSSPAPGQALR